MSGRDMQEPRSDKAFDSEAKLREEKEENEEIDNSSGGEWVGSAEYNG